MSNYINLPLSGLEEPLSDWRKVQAVNVEGVFMGCRAAIRVMKERGGSIINISSIEGNWAFARLIPELSPARLNIS